MSETDTDQWQDEDGEQLQGENPGELTEAFAQIFTQRTQSVASFQSPGYELTTKIKSGDNVYEINADNVESIEPSETSGTFMMRFKESVVENKGKIAVSSLVVTGTALAISTTLFRKRLKKQ